MFLCNSKYSEGLKVASPKASSSNRKLLSTGSASGASWICAKNSFRNDCAVSHDIAVAIVRQQC